MRHGRPGGRSALAAAAVAVAAGGWLLHVGLRTSAPPLPSVADALPTHSRAQGTGTGSPSPDRTGSRSTAPPAPTAMAFSTPARIRIPSIGVDAPITDVDLTADGDLPAPSPSDRNLAGWYEQSAAPGSAGNAVIDGHVDTLSGPAVFYLLGDLHRGDPVDITRRDGSVAEFTVDGVQLYPHSAVPADQVFGPADTPQLRLLTCGGRYGKATGYQGTVVVYAHLSKASAATHPTGGPGQGAGPLRPVAWSGGDVRRTGSGSTARSAAGGRSPTAARWT